MQPADDNTVFQRVAMNFRYEYAPLTTMQAASRVSVLLQRCNRDVHPARFGKLLRNLLRVAQLTDFLGEQEMHASVVNLHSTLSMCRLTGRPIDLCSAQVAVDVLLADWDLVLRESCTKWTSTTEH